MPESPNARNASASARFVKALTGYSELVFQNPWDNSKNGKQINTHTRTERMLIAIDLLKAIRPCAVDPWLHSHLYGVELGLIAALSLRA